MQIDPFNFPDTKRFGPMYLDKLDPVRDNVRMNTRDPMSNRITNTALQTIDISGA